MFNKECSTRSLLLGLTFAFGLASCGGGGGGSSSSDLSSRLPDGQLKPAVTSSAYASSLVSCVTADETSESCRLSRLPLISDGTVVPSIDQVMSQTVVSHDWMANRFREYLQWAPEDIRWLLGGVTAVVIASDIRPSFYTTLTGAIYLDPDDLWLTNAEKMTIAQDPDFRQGFGSDLQLVPLWRYTNGSEFAWRRYSLTGTEERTLDDIVLPISALLFHELAHANDFAPASLRAILDDNDTILQSIRRIASERASSQLNSQSPLNSERLRDLASVLYRGEDATPEQVALSPQEAGLDFEIDSASDLYAYSSLFEDVAMLFEEVMMHYHFGIDREVAFTNRPGDGAFCDDYVVAWGYRNRIGAPQVLARAESVLQWILNQNDVSQYLQSIPEPRALANGVGWCSNLNTFSGSTKVQSKSLPIEMRTEDLLPPHQH